MNWFKEKRIFLDYASATPLLPEVRRVMESYWQDHFHNPSAIYKEGVGVKNVVAKNRARMAHALGIAPEGIIFTSSGTESDNLAILGSYESFKRSLGKITSAKPHIIISAIEHRAVMATAEEVVRRGGELSILPVNDEGLVSITALEKLLKPTTFLVSIGLANSEIGTIEPVAKVGRLIRKYRKAHNSSYPYLHTDASQAPSFISINLESLQADLMTLDASKIYGPKGIGLLALRGKVMIHPIIFGGEQEGGRRAGTINPALISGFTLALEIALRDREKETERLENMRKSFINSITKNLPQAVINGSLESHLPNILSVSIPGILSEFLVLKLDRLGVLVSVGTSCSNDGRVNGSPVIRALGKENLSESTIRLSFGRFATNSLAKKASEIFCRTVLNVLK